MKLTQLALFALFAAALLPARGRAQNLEPDGSLPRATPESVGVSSDALADAIKILDQETNRVDSVMVLRKGKVVAEAWRSPAGPDVPHALYSLSKSFASTAIGFAIQEGKLSLDDKIVDLFPEDVPENPSENMKKVAIRHLLTMSCGHEKEPERPNNISAFYDRPGPNQDGNPTWIQSFMNQPFVKEPGTYYVYSTVSTYVATAALEKRVGESALDYLTPRLFEPLHIKKPVWEKSPEGICKGGTGLYLTTEDLAKFGQFYLQKGMWNGERLLSEAWVEEATSKQVDTRRDEKTNWGQGYGYQFWRCFYNAYRGDGAYGQYCVVAPDYDAVIIITSDSGNIAPILVKALDSILPKMGDEPLPENPDAVARLREVEKSLQPREGGVKSQLIERTVKDARGQDVRYIVYLPTGYLTGSQSYPVLYLLHGLTDDEKTWSSKEKGRMQGICDAYFAEKPERKRIIVMPDARDTWYRDLYGSDDKYETFFFETLIPQVEREFRCKTDRADRAVAGLSMGGYGTLLYALRHCDKFDSAYAMSPAADFGRQRPKKEETPEEELEARTKYAEENDVFVLLDRADVKALPRMTIDCGDDDFCLPGAFAFFQKARDKKADVQARVRDGVHSWDYWRVSLPKALDFISGDNP
ncbi:MAG: serine hydrolase [Thermoguttaceae bacterium]|nr:serine hydrolase [Thermoguttaceae bacterium]